LNKSTITITDSDMVDGAFETSQQSVVDGRSKRRIPAAQRTKPKWAVRQVTDLHQQICRLLTLGYTNSHISRITGITDVQVSNIRNSPLIKERVRILQGASDKPIKDAVAQIKELAAQAVDVLKQSLTDGDVPWPVRTKSATTVLSMCGLSPASPVVQITGNNQQVIVSPDVLDDIKLRARHAGILIQEEEDSFPTSHESVITPLTCN